MSLTCDHVAPGDLITADFVNCLLDKINALEKRVEELETSQLTPDWQNYFNNLLKGYLMDNDPRLLKLLDGWLKPGDTRIVDQIKAWLKPDDPWFANLLGNWIKFDDPRIQNILDKYVTDKGLVDSSELNDYIRTLDADGRYAAKTALQDYAKTTDADNRYATKTMLQDYTKFSDADGRYVFKSSMVDYMKSSDADVKYALKTDLDIYAKSADVTKLGAALVTATKVDLTNVSISPDATNAVRGVLNTTIIARY